MTNKINTQRLLGQVKKNIKSSLGRLEFRGQPTEHIVRAAVNGIMDSMEQNGQLQKYSIVYDEHTQEFNISFQPTMALSYITATFDVSDGVSPEIAAIIEE